MYLNLKCTQVKVHHFLLNYTKSKITDKNYLITVTWVFVICYFTIMIHKLYHLKIVKRLSHFKTKKKKKMKEKLIHCIFVMFFRTV